MARAEAAQQLGRAATMAVSGRRDPHWIRKGGAAISMVAAGRGGGDGSGVGISLG
jgi:hypothetical protein